jgi:hypothetical protein
MIVKGSQSNLADFMNQKYKRYLRISTNSFSCSTGASQLQHWSKSEAEQRPWRVTPHGGMDEFDAILNLEAEWEAVCL